MTVPPSIELPGRWGALTCLDPARKREDMRSLAS
jgi:hypothetical protein